MISELGLMWLICRVSAQVNFLTLSIHTSTLYRAAREPIYAIWRLLHLQTVGLMVESPKKSNTFFGSWLCLHESLKKMQREINIPRPLFFSRIGCVWVCQCIWIFTLFFPTVFLSGLFSSRSRKLKVIPTESPLINERLKPYEIT